MILILDHDFRWKLDVFTALSDLAHQLLV